jgi:hypothetical protein
MINNIKVLHLEPTTVCNAACPQCARENSNLYNDKLNRSVITLDYCKELFNIKFIKNLDKMFMCGNFGDPAANKESLDILRYFRKHNPSITLGMNTNGSIQNTKWWTEVGKLFSNPTDYVVFSIDGLEDTNHIYRRNVHWNKIIENATAFIQAGGSAHWDMLIFKHNEHQIDDAIAFAKDIGFSWFRSKVSKRFVTHPVEGIEAPVNFTLPNTYSDKIKCHVLKEQSIYVAGNGIKYPCCWIGSEAFNVDLDLKELLDTKNWQGLVDSWNKNPHKICSEACGVKNEKTSFESQWNKEIQLR